MGGSRRRRHRRRRTDPVEIARRRNEQIEQHLGTPGAREMPATPKPRWPPAKRCCCSIPPPRRPSGCWTTQTRFDHRARNAVSRGARSDAARLISITSSGSSSARHRSSQRPPDPAASGPSCAIGAAHRTRRRRCAERERDVSARPPIQPVDRIAVARGAGAGARHRCRRRPRSGAARRPGSSGRSRPRCAGRWRLVRWTSTAQPAPSSLRSETPTAEPALAADRLRRDAPPPAPAIDVAPVAPTSTTRRSNPCPTETPRQPQSPAPSSPRRQDPGEALASPSQPRGAENLNQALAHYRDALRIDPTNVTPRDRSRASAPGICCAAPKA